MDKDSENVLKSLYSIFNTDTEYAVSSPQYDKAQIDMLVNKGYITKIDASTCSGWIYILGPTNKGEIYFEQKKAEQTAKAKHIALEAIKWLLPTIVSIVALIVSILK